MEMDGVDRGDALRAEVNLIKKSILERFPTFDPEKIYLTPGEVLKALEEDEEIKSFLKMCREHPPTGAGEGVGLLFPDSNYKPLTEESPDKALRNLYTAVKNLRCEDEVIIYILSPMLGIIPPAFIPKTPNVEFSGLFSYQVRRRSLPWNAEAFRKVLDRTAEQVESYLRSHARDHRAWYAIIKKGSIEERIFERVCFEGKFGIRILYEKRPLSSSYLETRGLLSRILEEMKR